MAGLGQAKSGLGLGLQNGHRMAGLGQAKSGSVIGGAGQAASCALLVGKYERVDAIEAIL